MNLGLAILLTSKMPPGGVNCCMPGCTNYYQKTKDKVPRVSYMAFPSKEDHPEWRARLIAAVSRGDQKFNADKHKICTDHFDPKTSLLFHGKYFTDQNLMILITI